MCTIIRIPHGSSHVSDVVAVQFSRGMDFAPLCCLTLRVRGWYSCGGLVLGFVGCSRNRIPHTTELDVSGRSGYVIPSRGSK